MAYQFTEAEILQIEQARSLSPAGDGPTNYDDWVPFYTVLSNIIGQHISDGSVSGADLQGLKNAKLWLDVAIGANGNIGIHSAFIRAYTNRQGLLRRGSEFTYAEIQLSSNGVALNLYKSLRDGIDGSLPWLVPSIDQIARADASSIGVNLFGPNSNQPLLPGDTAIVNNAAWSGAIGFNLLGGSPPYQTWRLTLSGDSNQDSASPNTLDDFKNLLFAVDSFSEGLKAGFATGGMEFLEYLYSLRSPLLALLGQGPKTLSDFQAQFNINLASGNWTGFINDVAAYTPAISPAIKLITSVGVNSFLDMLMGASQGKALYGTTTDANFIENALTFFSLTPAVLQELKVEFVPTSSSELLSKALSDVNVRAAVVALSSISVQVTSAVAETLSLYDPATGAGDITNAYLRDRSAMLSWKMLYDSGWDQDDIKRFGRKPYSEDWDTNDIVGDWDFIDRSIKLDGQILKLSIDGKGPNLFLPDINHQIVFGSEAAETGATAIKGKDNTDNLYGGGGADEIFGGKGNDYLEGQQGNDKLYGETGRDVLIGGANNDLLDGGKEADRLEGGAGDDTYIIRGSDGGRDVIRDVDGMGHIEFDSITLVGASDMRSSGVWRSADGKFTYLWLGDDNTPADLIVTGPNGASVKIEQFKNNTLGIMLSGSQLPMLNNIYGTTGSDDGMMGNPSSISGTTGKDEIHALAGNDIIRANTNGGVDDQDRLFGEEGRDIIYAGNSSDVLYGGLDGDILYGGGGDDILYAENEVSLADAFAALEGPAGSVSEFINGGGGNDLVIGGAGADALLGGLGTDTIIAGAGDDTIWGDTELVASSLDWAVNREADGSLLTGGYVDVSGFVVSAGLGGDDEIYAGAGNDIVAAEGGDDYVDAGSGNDSVYGHDGNDILYGGSGIDTLAGDVLTGDVAHGDITFAMHGDDLLDGEEGDDTLVGGGGADVLIGGLGNDILQGDDNLLAIPIEYQGNDSLDGGEGNDSLFGNGGSDELVGGAGIDYLSGGLGNDFLDGGDGVDTLVGGAGADALFGGAGNDGIVGDEDGASGADEGDDYLDGEDGNDTLVGNGGNDFLVGGNGNDLLAGGMGNDQLFGDAGIDELQGGGGNDQLDGGTENDRLFGGDGVDILHGGDGADEIAGDNGNDQIFGDAGNDRLFGLADNDVLDGGDGDDVLDGGLGNDTLTGGLGNDLVAGGDGIDNLSGGDGADQLQGGLGDDTLDGGLGDDVLIADAGNDILTGGDGNDQLQGLDGADTLAGGAGNDTLFGDAGNDVYLFNLGDGQDVIYEGLAIGGDVLRFGTGILPTDITVARSGINLVFIHSNGVDRVTVANWYYSIDYQLGRIEFSDSTVWTADQVSNLGLYAREGTSGDDTDYGTSLNETFSGYAGNDTYYGNGGSDILIGGVGNDTLSGGDGADTYIFNLGDGADVIQETGSGIDVLRFGSGISRADVSFERINNDLVISHSNGTDSVRVQNWYTASTSSSSQIEQIIFEADGSILRSYEAGSLGTNITHQYTLSLGDGLKTIEDWGGVDTLMFGAGIADGAIVVSRYVNDLRLSHINGIDRVTIKDWFNSIEKQIESIAYQDSGTVLPASVLTTPFLTINGTAGNDYIQAGDAYGETINGGAGNDTIYAGGGNDVITGGTGNDVLRGGAGANDYYFNLGDGQDYIADGSGRLILDSSLLPLLTQSNVGFETLYSFGANDSVRIGQAISVRPTFVYQGTNTSETINGSIYNNIIYGQNGNDTLNANDGDDELYGGDGNDVLNGGKGRDLLYGGAGDDVLNGYLEPGKVGGDVFYGGAGNDTLNGGSGTDTYYFNLGDGQDTIVDTPAIATGTYLHSAYDTIVFGSGITSDSITPLIVGNDFFIKVTETDGITIRNGLDIAAYRVDIYRFADGSEISVDDLLQRALTVHGTSGNDVIYGIDSSSAGDVIYGEEGNDTITSYRGNDTLIGGVGDDVLDGGGGDDTYVFNRGDGHDTIIDSSPYLFLSENSIVFGPSISASDIILSRSVNDLILSISGSNDSITVKSYINSYLAIRDFVFTDGSTLPSGQEIVAALRNINGGAGDDVLTGTEGLDYIYGNDGNDILSGNGDTDFLYGGAGNDVISGGAGTDFLYGDDGNDTFLFNRGDGIDYIYDSSGVNDQLVLGPGLLFSDLNFAVSNTNLNISIQGTSDTITLNSQLDAANKPVERLILANGSSIGLSDIQVGSSAVDTLTGTSADSILIGGGGNDTLTGGAGNDLLNGGAGTDKLTGGVGDDIYVVDYSRDTTVENANEGTDTVQSSITWTLGSNLENLVLTGTTAINGTGNTANNLLIGNGANNTLSDTTGNDILLGGAGNDTLKDTVGNNLLDGGAGADTLTGGTGREIFFGGTGNDTISPSTGYDIIAFNRGDGIDSVVANTGLDNAISLGGGIRNTDLTFTKSSTDLILGLGAGEQIILKGWYSTGKTSYKSVVTLQMIEEASIDYAPGGSNTLTDNKVEQFNFAGLVTAYDQARAANPSLTTWAISNALLSFYLGGSDTAAIGGDLAYQYGKTGSLINVGLSAAQGVLGNTQFGQVNQAINQPGLSDGVVKLSA